LWIYWLYPHSYWELVEDEEELAGAMPTTKQKAETSLVLLRRFLEELNQTVPASSILQLKRMEEASEYLCDSEPEEPFHHYNFSLAISLLLGFWLHQANSWKKVDSWFWAMA